MSSLAIWLNETFVVFDHALMDFAYSLHLKFGIVLDPFLKIITHISDFGIFFIIVALLLFHMKKKRKVGFVMLVSLLLGLLIVNIILKGAVSRPRPYYYEDSIYYQYWLDIGAGEEIDFPSFPSGHSSSVFCACIPIFIYFNKKWSWSAILLAIIVAFSRIYLFVHYPSDVIAGIIIGILCAVLSIVIVNTFYRYCQGKSGKIAKFFKE